MTQHDHKGTTSAGRDRGSDAVSQARAGGYKVALRRTGSSVEIILTASTEYASIELYDRLKQSLENGSLRLDMASAP